MPILARSRQAWDLGWDTIACPSCVNRSGDAIALVRLQRVGVQPLPQMLEVEQHLVIEAPIARAKPREVGDVYGSGSIVAAQVEVAEQREDVALILLVQAGDLELGDEHVAHRQCVVVEFEPVAQVDDVFHLEGVEKDVHVVVLVRAIPSPVVLVPRLPCEL